MSWREIAEEAVVAPWEPVGVQKGTWERGDPVIVIWRVVWLMIPLWELFWLILGAFGDDVGSILG